MSRDVFISYCQPNSASAYRLCELLEKEEIKYWIAPRDIPPGQDWRKAIAEGIDRSFALVLLLSTHTKDSKHVSRELGLADERNLELYVFRLEDVTLPVSLQYTLINKQRIDAFGEPFESAVSKLAETIRRSPHYPAQQTYPVRVSPEPGPRKLNPPKPLSLPLKFLIAGLFLAMLLGAFLFVRPHLREVEAKENLRNGQQALVERDYSKAITNFTRVIQLQPENARALDNRAQAYHGQGRDDLARLDAKQATQTPDDGDVEIHRLNGDTLKLLHQHSEAVKEYGRFLNSHPENQQEIAEATQALNEVLAEMKQGSVGENWLQQVVDNSPPVISQRAQQLGNLRQRRFNRCENAPESKFSCYYDSSFDRAPSVTETVTLARESDGNWKPASYRYHPQ